MSLYSLKIGDKEFRVAIVDTEKAMKDGLAGKPRLGKDKGMLFNFKEPQNVTMNMQKMMHPIDMIFICGGLKVIDVRSMKPGDADTSCDDCLLVLEVRKGEGKGLEGLEVEINPEMHKALGHKGSYEDMHEADKKEKPKKEQPAVNIIINVGGITQPSMENMFKKGGSFKIYEDQVKAKKEAMQVLDDTGKILMNIVGGERIFSIKHTEKLVSLAKKVDLGEAKEEELGELMAEIIEVQNTQEPEYV